MKEYLGTAKTSIFLPGSRVRACRSDFGDSVRTLVHSCCGRAKEAYLILSA